MKREDVVKFERKLSTLLCKLTFNNTHNNDPKLKKRVEVVKKLINIKRVKLSNKRLIYKCEWCRCVKDIRMCDSRTDYPWNGKGRDPNRKIALCESCEKENERYWDEYAEEQLHFWW